jgi:hypothetical protein
VQTARLDEHVEKSALVWWTPDRPYASDWALDAAVVASSAAAANDKMSILRMMPSLKVLTGSEHITTVRGAQFVTPDHRSSGMDRRPCLPLSVAKEQHNPEI